jgi:hypothetical protein
MGELEISTARLFGIPIVVDLLLLFNVAYPSSGRFTAYSYKGNFDVPNYHSTRNFFDLTS